MANMSSANGKAAFLDLPINHEAVEHFQGLERFREDGLPHRLPSEREAAIYFDPGVVDLASRIACYTSYSEKAILKKQRAALSKKLKRKDLQKYRQEWIKDRQSEIIAKRGHVDTVTQRPHILLQLVPERKMIAELASLKEGLTEHHLRAAEDAFMSLCMADLSTIYRPGERPFEGLCPVCNKSMERFVQGTLVLITDDDIQQGREKIKVATYSPLPTERGCQKPWLQGEGPAVLLRLFRMVSYRPWRLGSTLYCCT
jgi:hypothetical protein